MVKDIAPELLEQIQSDFEQKIEQNIVLRNLQAKIENGTATWIDAQDYSIKVGELLEDVFKSNLSSDILPDGKMYYNIANRVLPGPIKKAYAEAANYAGKVQKNLNKKVGLGIKNVEHTINEEKVSHIVDLVSGKAKFDDIAYMLGAPIINLCQSAVDMTIKANAEFHYKAGLEPTITRYTDGKCCDWCSMIAGKYTYPDVPRDVYRRHKNCGCIVIYDPKNGTGLLQGVHSKQWGGADVIGARESGLDLYRDKMTPEERKALVNAKQRAARRAKKATRNIADPKGVMREELYQKYLKENPTKSHIAKNIAERDLKKIGLEKPLKKNPEILMTRAVKRDRLYANNFRNVDTGGLRNENPLTDSELNEAIEYAERLGCPRDKIVYSVHNNTAYWEAFDLLLIGTDVLPSPSGMTANSRVSLKGAIAHEIVGHRRAKERGISRFPVDSPLDEAQASIRAARFAKELSLEERYLLIRDAIERLHKNGLSIKDVKDALDIKEF